MVPCDNLLDIEGFLEVLADNAVKVAGVVDGLLNLAHRHDGGLHFIKVGHGSAGQVKCVGVVDGKVVGHTRLRAVELRAAKVLGRNLLACCSLKVNADLGKTHINFFFNSRTTKGVGRANPSPGPLSKKPIFSL